MNVDYWRHHEANDPGAAGGSGGGGELAGGASSGGGGGVTPPPVQPTMQAAADLARLQRELAAEREARAVLEGRQAREVEAELAKERVIRARLQASIDFPNADAELLAAVPFTDPQEILDYAKKLNEKALFQREWMATGGVPVPPANQTDAAATQQQMQLIRWRTQVRSDNLRKQMDPVEAEMAYHAFFTEGWNNHMRDRQRLGGQPAGEFRPAHSS